MYLPAFPAIEASFGSGEGTAQITLASWFVGLAFGQITQGTLADRFGRRVPLLVGLGLYTVASMGCALAPTLWVLTAMRSVAAFGGSAGMVIPRAVVRDMADGHAAAKLMSQLMLVMGVAPILAPTLGGAVLSVASWRVIFWFGAAYGLVSMALVLGVLPEDAGAAAAGAAGPGRDRQPLCVGVPGAEFSWSMPASTASPCSGCSRISADRRRSISSGSGLARRRMAPRSGWRPGVISWGRRSIRASCTVSARRRVLRVGVRGYLAASLVLAALAFGAHLGVASLFLPVAGAMFCMGFVMPNAAVSALSRHSAHAGSASALMGTLQFMLAAVSGTLVGWLTDGSPRPLAGLMLLGATCAVAADLFRVAPKKETLG